MKCKGAEVAASFNEVTTLAPRVVVKNIQDVEG